MINRFSSTGCSLTHCFDHPPAITNYTFDAVCGKFGDNTSHVKAAGLAHELKNPLTTVKGFIQLLEPELIKMGKQQQAEILIEEIDRATQLINTFLDVHKPNASKKPFLLHKIVKTIPAIFEGEAKIRGIALTETCEQEDIMVAGHSDQIKQILINLIKNALDAIEASGPRNDGLVHLRMYRYQEEALISVEDNGPGIEAHQLEALFLPFYTTKQTGTGIGLTISKNIIEDHGGRIGVKSTPGKGTTFTLSLPIHTKES
ncbi:HAMP domain-containing histidine kinase [Mesobacillus foraminis]|uniref:two-component system sensor histidine kinase NtrB n=1 Tax=Mesobacillus foraminis TaxID=279826 RepID=UPI001BE985BE|nr:HAMP domain-containing sensor histidine kinase [Mesobacillus foraminis]MBT2755065.1 HAMP domain-containing histidine kinase [Mesobacillus foraminis]